MSRKMTQSDWCDIQSQSSRKVSMPKKIIYSNPGLYLKQGRMTLMNQESLDFIEEHFNFLKDDFKALEHLYKKIRVLFQTKSAGGKTIGIHTSNDIIKERVLGGCHDFGLLVSSILRHYGIPTIMVDTTGINWAMGQTRFSGHIFLEVFMQNKWHLIDAVQTYVMTEYDVNNPYIPIPIADQTDGHYKILSGLDTDDYEIWSLNDLKRHLIDSVPLIREAYDAMMQMVLSYETFEERSLKYVD